jgi:hypothetical protein
VLDRARDIVRHNRGWRNQMQSLVDLEAVFATRAQTSLTLLFHPAGLRNALDNWEGVARAELSLLHTELRDALR